MKEILSKVLLFLCLITAGCRLDPVIYPGSISAINGTWAIEQQTITYTYADGSTFEASGGISGGFINLIFSENNKSSLGVSIGGPRTDMVYVISTQNNKRYISFTPKFDNTFEPYEITTQTATIMQWEASKTGPLDDGNGGTAVSAVSKVVLSKD